MQGKIIKIILGPLLLAAVAATGYYIGYDLGFERAQDQPEPGDSDQSAVLSFEDCVAAGNTVMPARQNPGVGGESYPRQCRTSAGQLFAENLNSPESKAGLIRLFMPQPGRTIKSPLELEGEARGNWFFEATFPVFLTDWDGRIIASHYAEAQDEWMTEEFVPFKATLEFDSPFKAGDPDFMSRGTLILAKSNASGLPEYDDALEITVYFSLR